MISVNTEVRTPCGLGTVEHARMSASSNWIEVEAYCVSIYSRRGEPTYQGTIVAARDVHPTEHSSGCDFADLGNAYMNADEMDPTTARFDIADTLHARDHGHEIEPKWLYSPGLSAQQCIEPSEPFWKPYVENPSSAALLEFGQWLDSQEDPAP